MDSDLMRWVKAQADDPNANPRFRELLAALEAAQEDAERLDWFDTNWFTAYRNCDPIGLSKHCVLVDESQRTRRRCVADTFRTAIDQARGKAGQPGETM